jgi:hypothetical protein
VHVTENCVHCRHNSRHTLITVISHFGQVFAAIVIACVFGGFLSLYAALVCIAGSQLEKLRASLLDITQTHVTAERDCGTQEAQGQARASQEMFQHMQKQLNSCIRHHQEIQRYA